MMSLQASLLGFAVFKVVPQCGLFAGRPLTVHENIVLQTTAVATGTLPLAAGLVGVIPALAQLDPALDGGAQPLVLSFRTLLAWSFAVAFFGVFLAVPLRKQVIVREQLVFPSGTATAQVIGVLHGKPLMSASDGAAGPARRRRRASSDGRDDEQVGLDGLDEEDGVRGIGGRGGKAVEAEKVVDRQAWRALTTSFAVSGAYTVRPASSPLARVVVLDRRTRTILVLTRRRPRSSSVRPSPSSTPSRSSTLSFGMRRTTGSSGSRRRSRTSGRASSWASPRPRA